MAKNVIKRPILYKAFNWDGTNLDEFKDNFPNYDIALGSDGRLTAQKISCTHDKNECYVCIIDKGSVVVKNMETGEAENMRAEIFYKTFMEVQSDQKNEKESESLG